MNPPRVVEQYPQSLEAQLLRAGQALDAPDSTFEATLGALGLGAAASAAASASGAARAKAWGWFATTTAKWTAVAIVVASGALVAARVARRQSAAGSASGQPQRPRAAATISKADAPPAALVGETAHGTSAVPAIEAVPPVSPRERRPSAAKSGDSLAAEVALIDAARQALNEGRAARASALLDNYDRQFKTPRLLQEATLLRARALEQLARAGEPQE